MEVRRALNQKLILTDSKLTLAIKPCHKNETAKIVDADQDDPGLSGLLSVYHTC